MPATWPPLVIAGPTGPAGPAGPEGPQGPAGISTLTFRSFHGFLIGGSIDSTVNVPDLIYSKATNQTSTLVGLTARIESGTSIDVNIRRNGSVVSTVTVTGIKETFALSQALSDDDALDLTFANPIATPKDLGATLIIEHVVTA